MASYELDPDPLLHVLERLAAILKIGFATVCNAWAAEGTEITPEHFEPPERDERSDSRRSRRTPSANAMSIDQAAMLFEMAYSRK